MFALVVGVGLLVAWVVGAGGTEIAQIGETAPDFTAELIDGGEVTLSELEGPVVLNFWASWCLPCRAEIPDISAYAEANPEVTVLGVAVEDVEEAAREFAAEIDASYPLALGTSEIESAYPRLGLPATYVLDHELTVVQIYNGVVTTETLEDLVQRS